MVKCVNSVTSTKSAMRCYICGSTSKDFNKIENMIDIKTNDLNLKFGLSILHAWIRFYECLLICHTKSVSKSGKRVEIDEERTEKFWKIRKGFKEILNLN